MEVIFTFERTNHAMEAEQRLLDAGFEVRVMNLPSSIKAGCGLCLRLAPKEAPAAFTTLCACGIPLGGRYLRQVTGAKSTYTPIDEEL